MPTDPPSGEVPISTYVGGAIRCWKSIRMSPDNTAFAVVYLDDYTASRGTGVSVIESRKNCQIGMLLQVPAGYTFAVTGADHRGEASLAAGTSASLRSGFSLEGSSTHEYRSHRIDGPLEGSWQATETVAPEALTLAPCGQLRYLTVSTELRLAAPADTPASRISLAAPDGDAGTTYHLRWFAC